MRHHDHAFAELMGGVLQQMNHLVGHLRVEAARRLVREDRAARGDQRAADRHPLTLAARQVHDVALGFLTAQTQFLEDLHIGLGADQPQVLFGGEVVDQVMVLEHQGHVLPTVLRIARCGDVLPFEADHSPGGGVQAGQQRQQRALAGAGRAGDRIHLPGFEIRADIRENKDLRRAVGVIDMVQLQTVRHDW